MARKPRQVSYRQELVEAISICFPPQWFSLFPSHGNSDWTAQKVFWVSLAMSWQPKLSLTARFQYAREVLREVFGRWKLGTSLSGFLEARQRLLREMWLPLLWRLQQLVSALAESWRVCGWLLFAVDGTRIEAPRTSANEQGLGCAGKESTTPQVFQTTLQHVGTSLPWDFRVGPGTDSERRHLDQLRSSLPEQSLLTADAGFISFDLCGWFINQNHQFLLRVGGNARLLTQLGWAVEIEGRTVYLWPKKQRHLPPIVLRLIVVRPEGRQAVYLVTNILDETLLSDAQAAELYRFRWGIELYYRTFKQTLGHNLLQSRTPEMALAEQTWHVFAAWLLQLLTAHELIAAGRRPASWSAAKARDAARKLLRGALADQHCHPSATFRSQLREAVKDPYQRSGPKQTRRWPRKKHEQPPGPPQLQLATKTERQQAKRLRERLAIKS
jgi:Transposase DDE domain